MAKSKTTRNETRARRPSKKTRPAGAKTPRTRAKRPVPKPAEAPTTARTADEAALLESLLAHGQAARARPDGTLPPGVTHELVEDERGELRAVRRRFSSF